MGWKIPKFFDPLQPSVEEIGEISFFDEDSMPSDFMDNIKRSLGAIEVSQVQDQVQGQVQGQIQGQDQMDIDDVSDSVVYE